MDFKKKMRRKRCRFCTETIDIDFKDANLLRSFISERGKILSGHITGVCTKHQRRVGQAIKRARQIALIPYINV
jgi:small subunit ribosomal protein S18